MKNFNKRPLKRITERIKHYSQEANRLVRQRVFTLHASSKGENWSLLDKVRAQRLPQRWQTFKRSGGDRSSIAEHALEKARKHQQP